MKLKMRRGKIKRPPGAKEPIIRLVGNAEAHLIHEEEQVSIPNTRKDWDELYNSECEDTPLCNLWRKELFTRQSLLNFADGVDLAAVPDNPITWGCIRF